MTNKEKYRDEIENYIFIGGGFAVSHSGNAVRCAETDCNDCIFGGTHNCSSKKLEWLSAEYLESKQLRLTEEIRNLKVDDKLLVSENGKDWHKAHFANYSDNDEYVVDCFCNGGTSWSNTCVVGWEYAKLPEE